MAAPPPLRLGRGLEWNGERNEICPRTDALNILSCSPLYPSTATLTHYHVNVSAPELVMTPTSILFHLLTN